MSLKLQNVTLTVPDGTETRTLLDDVSLEVAGGEVVALTGASGSGKSTLLAVAALLLRPDSGNVSIAGDIVPANSDRKRTTVRRNQIGVVYQSANLFPSLTALEQLELVSHIDGSLNDAARSRAMELLVTVGLEARVNARPAELSGGERQRVGIARALMNKPAVLLADEPTAALDAERGQAIMSLLVEQATQHGAAALVVTHLPQQIASSRVLEIDQGRLREQTPSLVSD